MLGDWPACGGVASQPSRGRRHHHPACRSIRPFHRPLFRWCTSESICWSTSGGLGLPADSGPLWQAVTATETDVIRVVGVAVFVGVIVALAVRAWARRGTAGGCCRGWHCPRRWSGGPGALAAGHWPTGAGRGAVPLLAPAFHWTGSPILAALAFVLLAFGEVMFVMRTGMAEEMNEDYVLTARAKGVPEQQVRDHHVGAERHSPRPLPILHRHPLSAHRADHHRARAGGRRLLLLFCAVEQVDVPLIVGTLVAIGVLGLIIWLSIDVLHAALDPRIRYEAAG